MNHGYYSTFLGKISNATRSGAVHWSETPDEDTYRLLLPAGMILVSAQKTTKHAEGQPPTEETVYEATFHGDSQIVVFTPQTPEEQALLRALHEQIARQVDGDREQLLRRLEQSFDEVVARGEREKNKPRSPQVKPSPLR